MPWPAITEGSSYGWMKVRPSRAAIACARAAASASVSPSSTTSAPCTCVLFTLLFGVPRGITITARTPSRVA